MKAAIKPAVVRDDGVRAALDLLALMRAGDVRLLDGIAKFQAIAWHDVGSGDAPVLEALRDVAYDLDYYHYSPTKHDLDPPLFGDEEAMRRLDDGLKAIRATWTPHASEGS